MDPYWGPCVCRSRALLVNKLDLKCLLLWAEEAQTAISLGKSLQPCWAEASLGSVMCVPCAPLGVWAHRPGSQATFVWCGPTLSSLTFGVMARAWRVAQAADFGVAPTENGHPFSTPAFIAKVSFQATVLEQTRQNSLDIAVWCIFSP